MGISLTKVIKKGGLIIDILLTSLGGHSLLEITARSDGWLGMLAVTYKE